MKNITRAVATMLLAGLFFARPVSAAVISVDLPRHEGRTPGAQNAPDALPSYSAAANPSLLADFDLGLAADLKLRGRYHLDLAVLLAPARNGGDAFVTIDGEALRAAIARLDARYAWDPDSRMLLTDTLGITSRERYASVW